MAFKAKAAFSKFIDDSSIVLFPHPINGKAFYFLIPDDSKDSTQLSWQPEYVEVSNDGSLGFTYGPAQSKRNIHDSLFTFSHYMSIWKKSMNKNEILRRLHFSDIINSDTLFNHNPVDAFDENTIFFRMGKHPFHAKDSIPKDITEIALWKVLGGDISDSGDLAYVYGYFGLNNDKKEKGYFIRIWKFENNKWYLRVDLRFPVFM
jgi:hypothetical protein